MAMFTCNCPSYLLGHETRFNVYLPEYAEDNVKTLYLLHGMGDDCTTWFRRTSAERYIRSHTAALICPDGENSFYTDMAVGKPYYSYIINELIPQTRRMFHLSERPEDTFVAGISMGGYGAFMLALRNPDIFGAAASLSGVTNICAALSDEENADFARPIWGDDYCKTMPGSDADLFALADRLIQAGKPFPRLYQMCGISDLLLEDNRKFSRYLQERNIPLEYHEVEGTHEWGLWDRVLPDVLKFVFND